MDYSYDMEAIKNELSEKEGYWRTFFSKSDFKLGVIYLQPGEEDTQSPHPTDEVYFIVEGDGFLNIDGKDYDVKPLTALYVPRDVPHHFHSNTKSIFCYYVFN